jgi:hypothetical protein
MRNDVHFAALRAAAKVAFSVAFVSGCSAAGSSVIEGEENETTESEINTPPQTGKKPAKTVGKKPCASKDAGKPSCESVLASTFGDGGAWPTGDEKISAEAKACCGELVVKSMQDPTAEQSPYHWQCCSATNWGADLNVDGGVGWACTPWGPPVPPAMKRKKVFLEEPEAWIGVA